MNILSVIIGWIASNPGVDATIIVAIYEFICRKMKTKVSISVLDFIKTAIDEFIPNKIEGIKAKEIIDNSIEKIEQKTESKNESPNTSYRK